MKRVLYVFFLLHVTPVVRTALMVVLLGVALAVFGLDPSHTTFWLTIGGAALSLLVLDLGSWRVRSRHGRSSPELADLLASNTQSALTQRSREPDA